MRPRSRRFLCSVRGVRGLRWEAAAASADGQALAREGLGIGLEHGHRYGASIGHGERSRHEGLDCLVCVPLRLGLF